MDYRYDVVVVGNVGIDTNVYFHPGSSFDDQAESCFTEDIDYIGQAGGYTARGFAQLGYRTAFIGHVGDDFAGHFIRETLAADGINTEGLFVDPAGTSRSVNMMYADGRRRNFYDGKSHMTLHPDLKICRELLASCRLALFHLPNWARELLPLVNRDQTVLACDLQDLVDPDDPYRHDFLDAADIIFFSCANHAAPEPLMTHFFNQKAYTAILCGLGEHGCAAATGPDAIRRFAPVKDDRPVIDTNGAGDGLATGFLSGFVLENMPFEQAVQRGQRVARHTCTLKADTDHLIRPHQLA
jgi:sugar/nucleoside kinase (ribokinase family)